ncbi:hypothetical protein B0H13DRAFT_2343301 [Mycena leptocephala]|nr:hypothetical protein B0H13DRAFT_2343301 [Mycena leptocephala]
MDANNADEPLQRIITALQNVATTRYISAAGLVPFLYDHLLTLPDEVEHVWSAPNTLGKILFLILRYMVLLLTLPDEVEHVWSAPNTLGKILFLILRYMVPIFMMVETITRSGLPVIAMSDVEQVTPGLTAFATYAGWLSIVISKFLVLLCIWTTLPRGHQLIAWSLAFFIFMQLASFSVTTWVVSNMIPVLVFEPFVGVCTFTTKPSMFGPWVVGLAFEVVVFVTMLFRDGVVYFLILFVLRIANTVIAVVAPISQLFVIVFFIWATTTLMTSRLIINSRRQAAKAR